MNGARNPAPVAVSIKANVGGIKGFCYGKETDYDPFTFEGGLRAEIRLSPDPA